MTKGLTAPTDNLTASFSGDNDGDTDPPANNGDNEAVFIGLTVGQIAFNENAVPIMLFEPTPFGEAIVGAINLAFLVYNNPPTLKMSRYKPEMKGGKQAARDAGTKGRPKGIKDWLDPHSRKDTGAPDFTTKEINELYKEWLRLGKPTTLK